MEPVRVEFLMVDGMSVKLRAAGKNVEVLRENTKEVNEEMKRLDKASDKVKDTIGKLAAAFTARELVSKIANVRGEFQKLEVAFTTMLGSSEKANDLMQQLVHTAAITPFDLQGVSEGAKQLLAYGEDVSKVNDDLIRLGNIAAGLSQPLNDIVYLYGTTMTQGRLYTQDLNQFTGRGIPMIRELAKVFGVAEDKVKTLVEEGKVGFPEVQKVIQNLTNEGGMFYNLMEEQSKTISGQIANIGDAIDTMFNEIGKQSEGVINSTLEGVGYLVENYQKVGQVLLSVAATYGTYKAAVMAVTAAHSLQAAGIAALTVKEAIYYGWLVIVEKAQKLLNATMLSNPYVLVATAIAATVAALWTLSDSTDAAEAAQNDMNDALQKAKEKQEAYNRETQNAISTARDEAASTDDRREAMNLLIQRYPSIIKKYIDEEGHLTKIAELKREIAELDGKRTTANVQKQAADNQSRLNYLLMVKRKGIPNMRPDDLKWYNSLADTAKNSIGGIGITIDQVIEYWRKRTDITNRNVTVDKVKNFQNSLGKMDTSQLDRLLTELGRASSNVKGHKATYVNSLKDYLTASDIESLKTTAEGIRNARGQKTGSSADWGEAARKKYQKALKAYNDFQKSHSNKLTKSEYEKKSKDLKDALDSAKKEYDATKPGEDKEQTKADKAAARVARQQERERQKEEKAEERRVQAKEDLGERMADLEVQNQERELAVMDEGREKRLKEIEKEYQQEKAAIEKNAHDLAGLNKKAGLSGLNENGLTKEQQDAIDKANRLNESKKSKAVDNLNLEETSAMREYLKQYGDYQQQKLAIAEEYAEKIRKAQNEGERLSLQAEMEKMLAELDTKTLKEGMDWEGMFGNLDTLTRKQLEKVKDELRKMLSSGGIDIEGYKTAVEQIDKVNDAIISAEDKERSFFTFTTEHAKERRKLEMEVADAQARQNDLIKEQAEAQADLTLKRAQLLRSLNDAGVEGKSDISSADAQSTLSKVGKKYGTDSRQYRQVQKAFDELAKSERDLNNVTKKRAQADKDVTTTTSRLNNFLNDVREKLKGFIETFSKINDNLQELPGLFTQLGVDPESEAGQRIQSVADAGNSALGAMTDFASGNYIGALSKGLSAFSSLGTAIFGGGESDPHLKEDLERLAATNEALQTAIEDLTEEMKDAPVEESKAMYDRQQQLLNESEANMQEMMGRSGAAYKKGFLGMGGHHSTDKKINDAMSGGDWSRITTITEQAVNSAGDFWNLTSEQMRKVADEAPDLYAKIKGLADDGYKDAAQYMDDYIEFAKQRKELETAYYEKMTGTSFDTLRGQFKDFLTDMTKSWDDATADMGKLLEDSIAEALMTKKYDPLIHDFQEKWAEYMEDGKLSDAELADLEKRRDEILGMMENDRNELSKLDTGGTSQSAKSGGFTAMTQDQGTKLEGMFTSGLQHWSSMDQRMEEVSVKMSLAEGHLAKIEENTGMSATHLNEIKEDLKKVIRDGLKVK